MTQAIKKYSKTFDTDFGNIYIRCNMVVSTDQLGKSYLTQ